MKNIHGVRAGGARWATAITPLLLGGCSMLSHVNTPLADPDAVMTPPLRTTTAEQMRHVSTGSWLDFEPPGAGHPEDAAPLRTSFNIDGSRGNPDVLFVLSLSGGGSRSAYLSAAVMANLRNKFPQVDLLSEVDVISSVSGGSLASAHYVASRDVSARVLGDHQRLVDALESLQHSAVRPAWADQLSVMRHDSASQGPELTCTGPLSETDAKAVRQYIDSDHAWRTLKSLCEQQGDRDPRHQLLVDWTPEQARAAMTQNFGRSTFWNLVKPNNVARYWTTAFDRSDVLAQTLAQDLLGETLFSDRLHFNELNPLRPFLLINSTNATRHPATPGRACGPNAAPPCDGLRFGGQFTFTQENFSEHLQSDASTYPLAYAVAASAAFPMVFPYVSLRDYRPASMQAATPTGAGDQTKREFLHVFDGGNADNLGLKAVKTALIHRELNWSSSDPARRGQPGGLDRYKAIVVIQVDAFTNPDGASRSKADPRAPLDHLIDTNLSVAVDTLLMENRRQILQGFRYGSWRGNLPLQSPECKAVTSSSPLNAQNQFCLQPAAMCDPETHDMPLSLCGALRRVGQVDLSERFVFYHLGFDDLENDRFRKVAGAALQERLNRIPTALAIDAEGIAAIDRFADVVIGPQNPCLAEIAKVLHDADDNKASAAQVSVAKKVCANEDKKLFRSGLISADAAPPNATPTSSGLATLSRP